MSTYDGFGDDVPMDAREGSVSRGLCLSATQQGAAGGRGEGVFGFQTDLLVEIDDFDALHASFDVLLREQRLTVALLVELHEIRHEHAEDGLRGVRHQDAPPEVGVPNHEGHGRAVVEVEVRDQHAVNCAQVHLVEIRQRRDAGVPRVDAAVEHDALALVFGEHARSAHLRTGAEGHDLQHVVALRGRTGRGDGPLHPGGYFYG